MNKLLILILTMSLSYQMMGQVSESNADNHSRSLKYKSSNVRELTTALTSPLQTDLEKARAIYTWIAENISYDTKNTQGKKPQNFKKSSYTGKKKTITEMADSRIKETLKKRKGVSEDYSGLFTKMCELAGIMSITIEGAARIDPRLIGKSILKYDHKWNAVIINNKWYIVDATWGAGTVDRGKKKFIKQFRSEFFMIDPSISIMTHYPKEEKYQFLQGSIKNEVLASMPVTGYGYLKYRVSGYSPEQGSIKSTGQTAQIIKIKFGTDPPEKFLLAEGAKITEIQAFKSNDGFYYFGYDLKSKTNRIITISGVNSGQTYDIITYKID